MIYFLDVSIVFFPNHVELYIVQRELRQRTSPPDYKATSDEYGREFKSSSCWFLSMQLEHCFVMY